MARKATFLTVLAAAAVILALTTARPPSHADDSAESAGAGPPATQSQVALVDLARVFKNHPGFRNRMEQLKTELIEIEQQFQAETRQIKALQERLKTLDEQTDDHRGLKELISVRQSSQQSVAVREKQRFTQMEADVYAEAYKHIQREIEVYARSHGIRLVIRFNSEPIDTSDANSLMKGINRQVLFQDGLDITAEVLRLVDDE